MQRVNVSFEDNLLARTTAYAKKCGLSRSALVSIALHDYLEAKEKEPELLSLMDEFEKKLKELLPAAESDK